MSRIGRNTPDTGGDLETGPAVAGGRVFAFRADHEMLTILGTMPNASEFIRKAILRSLEEPCPVCEGRGVVTPGFRSEMERLGGHVLLRRCDCCANEYPAPCDAQGAALSGSDRLRFELQTARGENVCAACFERAAPCASCGKPYPEHAPAEFAKHWRSHHCGRALVTVGRAPAPAAADKGKRKGR